MVNKPMILETESQQKYQDLFSGRTYWHPLEAILQEYVKDRRWFRSKARDIQSCGIQDVVPLNFLQSTAYIVLLQVDFTAGKPETYIIPVMIKPWNNADEIMNQYPSAVIAHLIFSDGEQEQICFDATVNKDFCSFLLDSISQERNFKGVAGEIDAICTRTFRHIRDLTGVSFVPNPVKTEQTNTSIVYGKQAILKLFRRIEDGVNPELEIGRFLTEKTTFTNFAPLLGVLEYHLSEKPVKSIAVLQSYVPNKGDAWQYTEDSLEHYFNFAIASPKNKPPPVPRRHFLSMLKKPTLLAKETVGTYLTSAQLLGKRTAELHKALSSVTNDPDFAPEPFTMARQISLFQSLRNITLKTLLLLEERRRCWPEDIKKEIEQVLKSKDAIIERYQLIPAQKISAVVMRCHGDYHLGQVLYTGKDFVIIDFEGEPGRPLSERRSKISPIQDVAGMLRSFDYASQSVLNHKVAINARKQDISAVLQQWTRYWYAWVSITFLRSYLEHMRGTHLIPEDPGQLKVLLDAFLLEKNIYEIDYELNNRPDWLKVPIRGILHLLESG